MGESIVTPSGGVTCRLWGRSLPLQPRGLSCFSRANSWKARTMRSLSF